MINKVKKFLQSTDKQVLLKNFFSLSILQGLNLVLPLVTFPYLKRTLGIENFGLLMFSSAFITYFQILTEYSFNMTATKEIAVHSDNKEKMHEIFNDVLFTKLFLLGISFIVLTLLLLFVPFFKEHRLVYLFTFGNIIGQSIFPMWFFQGIQKMKYITYINFCSKVLFTIAIFVFVKHKTDAWLAALFTACGYILAGALSLYYVLSHFKVAIKRQPFARIKQQIILGRYLFLSELKVSIFTNTNTVLLGIIAGNTAVGYFASAEKLSRAIGNLYAPLTSAMFPYMSQEILKDKHKTYKDILRITKLGTLIFIAVLIPVFIFAGPIIELIFGADMQNSVLIFRILLVIPVASFIDNMFGRQILLTLGKDKFYFNVILAAAVSNIVLNLVLTYYYSYIGTAIALMMTQVIIDIGMYYYARKVIKT